MGVPSLYIHQALCKTLSAEEAPLPWHDFSLSDWMEFACAAQFEKVAPLLYYRFRQSSWPVGMPEGVRTFLTKEFYGAAAGSSLMFGELERVLSRLEANGVEAILLKGAALALTVYPDPALRPMGDIDLLIRPSDLRAAVDALEAMGYEPENPPMRRGLEYLFFFETNFRGGYRSLLRFELHWNLMGGEGSRYRPNIDWFWEQTRAIRVGKASALILSPTAHLLYAAVHASMKHGGDSARLLWLYDLHLIVERCPDVDWRDLLDKAQAFHWAPAVRAVLAEVSQVFSTSIPGWVHDALAEVVDPESQLLVERTAQRDQTRTLGAWRHLAFLGWKARFQWLAAVVFPDPAYICWRYRPKISWLWPACYVTRWVDIGFDLLITISRRRCR